MYLQVNEINLKGKQSSLVLFKYFKLNNTNKFDCDILVKTYYVEFPRLNE